MSLEYTIPQAAKALGLKEPTMRKYYMQIEKQGLKFSRTQQGHVMFNEEQLHMIREIMDKKNQPRTTLEQAINSVIVNQEDYDVPQESGLTEYSSDSQNINEKMDKLLTLLDEQQKESQERENKLLNMIERLEKKLDEQDQKSLKEQEELKRLEKESGEEEYEDNTEDESKENTTRNESPEPQKKGFWSKLFGG